MPRVDPVFTCFTRILIQFENYRETFYSWCFVTLF